MMELDIFELMMQRDFYNICISLSIFLCAFLLILASYPLFRMKGKVEEWKYILLLSSLPLGYSALMFVSYYFNFVLIYRGVVT